MMHKKLGSNDGESPRRPAPLVIGGAVYIAGFLAVVYVVGIGKLPLGPWAPYIAKTPRSVAATTSPMPLLSSSPQVSPSVIVNVPVAAVAATSSAPLRASAATPAARISSAHPRIAGAQMPGAKGSPYAKARPKTAVKGAPPAPAPNAEIAEKSIAAPPLRTIKPPALSVTSALPRGTAPAAPIVRGVSRPHAVLSHPSTKVASARTESGDKPRESFVLLLPVQKSRTARAANELDPRAGERGSLLINPSAAPTPQASSSGSQSQ